MRRSPRQRRRSARRWERVAARPLPARVAAGAAVAAIMGALFSVLALLVALAQGSTVLRGRGGHTISLWAVLVAYLAAGPLTGAAFGALFRVTRTPVGAYGVGLVASLPVIAAVCWGLAGPPAAWGARDWVAAAVLGLALGGPGGLIVRRVTAG